MFNIRQHSHLPIPSQSYTTQPSQHTPKLNNLQKLRSSDAVSIRSLDCPTSSISNLKANHQTLNFCNDIESMDSDSDHSVSSQSDRHKVIVILGGTKGIGMGLANEFLKMNHRVMITGQNTTSQENAQLQLTANNPEIKDHLKTATCNLQDVQTIQNVWDQTKSTFGRVDYWITCAGISQPMSNPDDRLKRLVDMQPQSYKEVVDVNLIGSMNSAKVAIPAMESQGGGHFYLFEGFGSDGTIRTGLTPYGSSKVGVNYLTKALAKEIEASSSCVKVGSLSPGIVITDLLKAPYVNNPEAWEKDKKIYNILADQVEPVTQYLSKEILKNNENGKTIEWLTPLKAIGRFITSPFVQRNHLE